MSDLLEGLNDNQRLAVTTTEGPVMVMAGAGSGKTSVLTKRISYIINELGVNPYSVLAVTFTNKAAQEMKERIEKLIDINTKFMWISTFHSFCVRVLRSEVDNLPPYKKGFNIIDDDDQLKIVRDICKACNFDSKPKELLRLISKEKNGMLVKVNDPSLASDFSDVKVQYQDYLKKNNLFDFDDLILKTIELFNLNPNILLKYQNQFNYIMVDEFQDTNTLQYNLMKMLASKNRNLFVVGDDFQSIYSFRGAKIENINKMRMDFTDTKLILLEKNYRSTTEILNLANCVIKNNPNQIKKVMKSNDKTGIKPILFEGSSAFDEVSFVVDKIKELHEKGDKYSDFAILYRANFLSREFEDLLIKNRIPYKIWGGLSFFQRAEVKDMLAYLKVLVNHNDNFSFERIINVPKRKIGNAILAKLEIKGSELGLSYYDSIPEYVGSGEGRDNLFKFKEIMDSIYLQIDNLKLVDILDTIYEEFHYDSYLKEEYSDDKEKYREKTQNIGELKSVLKEADEFYEGNNFEKLEAMLADLSLRTDSEEFKDDDCVRLSTFHQAKGLEFKTVFMPAMENGIFPSDNISSTFELEEERRICYVGITRAKENLFMSCAKVRNKYGQTAYLPKSCFIDEMDEKYYSVYKKPVKKAENSPYRQARVQFTREDFKSKEEPKNNDTINVGDKINHKAFGDGIVVQKNGEIITVAFKAEIGIKKLKADHPAIKKL